MILVAAGDRQQTMTWQYFVRVFTVRIEAPYQALTAHEPGDRWQKLDLSAFLPKMATILLRAHRKNRRSAGTK